MKIKVNYNGNKIIIGIDGNLKYGDGDEFNEIIENQLKIGGRLFVFDLSLMPYINSAVIGQFVSALKKIKEKEGRAIFCGVRPYIQNIFEITRLLEIFEITSDVNSALDKLN
ncbi:MAG: STAS domain-containing protein [Candidatus Muiribacteriota bacterium]